MGLLERLLDGSGPQPSQPPGGLSGGTGRGTPLVCAACGASLPSASALLAHLIRQHFRGSPFPCVVVACNEQMQSVRQLRDHLRDHLRRRAAAAAQDAVKHSATRHTCERCPLDFSSVAKLRRHRRDHAAEAGQAGQAGQAGRRGRCRKCGEDFAQKRQLYEHERVVHGRERHPCELCELAFVQPQTLYRHVRIVHLDQRPFRCDKCLWSFARSAALRRHHCPVLGQGARAVLTCPGCSAPFRSGRSMASHLRVCPSLTAPPVENVPAAAEALSDPEALLAQKVPAAAAEVVSDPEALLAQKVPAAAAEVLSDPEVLLVQKVPAAAAEVVSDPEALLVQKVPAAAAEVLSDPAALLVQKVPAAAAEVVSDPEAPPEPRSPSVPRTSAPQERSVPVLETALALETSSAPKVSSASRGRRASRVPSAQKNTSKVPSGRRDRLASKAHFTVKCTSASKVPSTLKSTSASKVPSTLKLTSASKVPSARNGHGASKVPSSLKCTSVSKVPSARSAAPKSAPDKTWSPEDPLVHEGSSCMDSCPKSPSAPEACVRGLSAPEALSALLAPVPAVSDDDEDPVERKWRCAECGAHDFDTHRSLQNHLMAHLRQWPFVNN